ncbi:MAG: 50S ribosomal protein L9 [bacterium]|nr:50S ribosomal protein L9 [bacterium]
MMAANINVILARDVVSLGRLGEVVKVRPGYARNFLFPRLLALPVSLGRMSQFEHQKRMIEHTKQKLKAQSLEFKNKLADVQITVFAKVGAQGKLFGSIGTRDIEKGMKEQGYAISHRDIKLENPIKTVGLHQVEVRLEGDVKAMLNVVVAAEVNAEEEAAKEKTELAVEAAPVALLAEFGEDEMSDDGKKEIENV